MSSRTNVRLIGILLCLLTLACFRSSTTEARIDALLRERIPIGTTHGRVVQVLDSLGIEHSHYDPDDRQLRAIWRRTSRSLFEESSIRVLFYFDANGALAKYELKRHTTAT